MLSLQNHPFPTPAVPGALSLRGGGVGVLQRHRPRRLRSSGCGLGAPCRGESAGEELRFMGE